MTQASKPAALAPIAGVFPISEMHWETADPFLFCAHHVDHYPPGNGELGPAASLAGRELGSDFAGKDGWRMYHGTRVPGFPAHPHRGFETITLMRKGLVDHSDSLGATARFGEGDVQWMTAGSGLLHKEFHEKELNRTGGPFQMVQLWVNLPAKDKMTEPKYQAITNAEMGRVKLPLGGEVEIIAGEYGGVNGPATTFTPVHLYNLKMKQGETVELSYPEGYTTALLAIEGSALLNGEARLPDNNLALFERDGETLRVAALEDGIFLLMSGEPLNEPIAQYGPFLMNTQAEIAQAIDDYQQGKFGYLR